MFDIVHKFNMLLCFKKGSNNITEPMNTNGKQSIDNGVQPQHGARMQPVESGEESHDSGVQSHDSGLQPHDVATHEAYDGNFR